MNSSPVSESDSQLLSLNQEPLTSDKQCKIKDMGYNTGVINTFVLRNLSGLHSGFQVTLRCTVGPFLKKKKKKEHSCCCNRFLFLFFLPVVLEFTLGFLLAKFSINELHLRPQKQHKNKLFHVFFYYVYLIIIV